MTNEELKKKIIGIIDETVRNYCAANVYVDHEGLVIIADALIEAGFSFKDDFEARARLLLTAANHYEEEKDREKQRADKAERALRKAVRYLSGTRLSMMAPDGSILTSREIPEQEMYEMFLSQAGEEPAEGDKE